MKIMINVPAEFGQYHDRSALRTTLAEAPVLQENPGKPALPIMPQWAEVDDLPRGAYRVTLTLPRWAEKDAQAVLETFGETGCEISGPPGSVITPFRSNWITVEN